MPIYEPYGALDWLFSVLNPLAAGGAHHGLAPMNAATPFTVYSLQSGLDMMVVGAYRVWNDGLYAVKAVGPATSADAVMALAAANDTALHRQGGVPVLSGTGLMLSASREETLIVPETDINGLQWINAIGIYRIYIQAQ